MEHCGAQHLVEVHLQDLGSHPRLEDRVPQWVCLKLLGIMKAWQAADETHIKEVQPRQLCFYSSSPKIHPAFTSRASAKLNSKLADGQALPALTSS